MPQVVGPMVPGAAFDVVVDLENVGEASGFDANHSLVECISAAGANGQDVLQELAIGAANYLLAVNAGANGYTWKNPADFASSGHTHDDRYYTETEIDTWRNGVTQTDMGYLSTISSDLQAQLNGKQASDDGLTSLAGLSYVSASFVKMTGADTFTLRTLQETSDDLEATIDHDNLLNFVAAEHLSLPNTIASVLSDHNLAAHTGLGLFDQSSDVDHDATTNFVAAEHVSLPNTIANVLSDHNQAAHTGLGLQVQDAVLDDLAAIVGVVANNEFIVGTGAGTYAHESGVTARTSLGLGTGNSPTFSNIFTVDDDTYEIGAVDKRFLTLYLSGLLSDGTAELTIANTKTAYDHSQDNTQAHSDYLTNNASDTMTASGITLTLETADATDPRLCLKTTNTVHEVCLLLDESAVEDHVDFVGQTAAVNTRFHVIAQSGQSAYMGVQQGSYRGELICGASGHISLKNTVQDVDLVFGINDGGVAKTITWDADVDKLLHSAGTFDLGTGNILTTGIITSANLVAPGVDIPQDEDYNTAWVVDTTGALKITGFTIPAQYFNIGLDATGKVGIRASNEIYICPSGAGAVGWFSASQFAFLDNAQFRFGSTGSASSNMRWSTLQTVDTLMMALNDAGTYHGRTLLICSVADVGFNFAHTAQANPTIFIHSDNQSTTQWLGLTHNQTDGVISAGIGAIRIENPLRVKESATAVAYTAGYGQYWVKNTAPCIPMFSDDEGTEFSILTTPFCHVRKNTTQVVTNDTITAVIFDGDDVEESDNLSFHSPTTNNTRFTVPAGCRGIYHVFGVVTFAQGNGAGQRGIFIRKNGVTTGVNAFIDYEWIEAVSAEGNTLDTSTFIELDDGDYVELFVLHTDGANLNIVSIATSDALPTELRMARIAIGAQAA